MVSTTQIDFKEIELVVYYDCCCTIIGDFCNEPNVRVSTYLLVKGPTNGLAISCMMALEANISPTATFSFTISLKKIKTIEETDIY